jgi:hypothetical protein
VTENQVQGLALIATLVSMPLISWGSTDGPDALTVIGAVLLVAGLATLTASRYIDFEEDP